MLKSEQSSAAPGLPRPIYALARGRIDRLDRRASAAVERYQNVRYVVHSMTTLCHDRAEGAQP